MMAALSLCLLYYVLSYVIIMHFMLLFSLKKSTFTFHLASFHMTVLCAVETITYLTSAFQMLNNVV